MLELLPERLKTKIQPAQGPMADPCWLWTARRHRRGYGQVRELAPSRRVRLAHLVVYELLCGPRPEGLEADHLCHNTSCVHPGHLEFVTHKENAQRSDGSWLPGERNRTKTHCPKGHPYVGANVYVRPGDGGRECRTCGRAKRATLPAQTRTVGGAK